jgi:hypothetical protein
LYAPEVQAVKEETTAAIQEALVLMLHVAGDGATARELEEHVWKTSLEFGRALMSAGLRRMCTRATARDIKERGLDPKQVTLRLDGDYHATLSTTLGPVTFPWFAYRDRSAAAATVTHTPAKAAVLPLFKHCRSSELLLEWESRLGSDHPFRHAQEALSFFTHGAAYREDTTIARHMVTVGSLVGREWTYRTPEDIAHLLLTRATVDPKTGRPVEDEHTKVVTALNHNADRIDYEHWRPRGYQIGSGAMESLHRTGSQTRLKVAGIRCLPETSEATFNPRMLRLCGRWDVFWRQDEHHLVSRCRLWRAHAQADADARS